jgi:peptidylprolyl isomerase
MNFVQSSLFTILAGEITMHFLRTLLIGACSTVIGMSAFAADAPTEVDIKKVSEGFGNFIGKNLKSSGLDFDIERFIQGIRDGLAGKPAPLSDKEYEQQMMLLQERAFAKLSDDNLKAAEEFLKKNGAEKGVVEIEPGKLQILIVKEGKGAEVKEGNAPQIQYTGKYIDGTTFGSSQDSGGPITIPLDQTIPGFSKGLKGMKEGEVRKIVVHPDLGYGKTGHLPPNSLLIFEVELIKADNAAQPLLDSKDESQLLGEADASDDDDDDDDDDEEEEDLDKTKETKK